MSRGLRSRRLGLLLVLSAFVPTGTVAAQDEDDRFAAAKAEYDKYMKRLPLLMHTRGREKLAQCRDVRALEILARSYARPEDPKAQVQYLIAAISTKHFRDEEHVPIYADWRARHRKPQDSWLWFRSLVIQDRLEGPDFLCEIIRGKQPLFLKAAAIEALATNKAPEVLPLITEMLGELPSREIDRAVMIESLAHCLTAQGWQLGDEEFTAPAEMLIKLMADKKTLPRTKLTLSRYLGKMFKVDYTILEADPWLRMLARGEPNVVRDKSKDRYTQPKFFDIKATGTRICYVIDMSDSMCAKVDPKLKRKGAVTGVPKPDKDKKKKHEDLGDETKVNWTRVDTRFDLAREQLKASLHGLGPDRSFCVVWFGDTAELLDSTPGMIKASKGAVSKVCRELDAITQGDPTPRRPHGTLRGVTNLHGGLCRAFQVKKRGLSRGFEYVDGSTFEEGCDSIFLLSDGNPTWDDWEQLDTNHGEDRVGDPESGIAGGSGGQMHYSGPYRRWDLLIEDVKRLNLFRKVEMLCIGIGEVQFSQLDKLAKTGIIGTTHRPEQ